MIKIHQKYRAINLELDGSLVMSGANPILFWHHDPFALIGSVNTGQRESVTNKPVAVDFDGVGECLVYAVESRAHKAAALVYARRPAADLEIHDYD